MRRKRQANIPMRWLVITLVMTALSAGTWGAWWWFEPIDLWGFDVLRTLGGVLGAVSLWLAATGGWLLSKQPPSMLRRVTALLLAALGLGGLDSLLFATTGWLLTTSSVGIVAGGALALALLFVGLLALARFALGRGGGVPAVARALLDEAMHMKVAVVFIVLLLTIIPALPFLASFSDTLRYQVQSFLSYSMTATVVLLSLLTIFLACWTVSGELEQKQIFTIATKPLGRVQYLMGKWVGIVVLNGILLAVASAGIWGFTTQYLAKQEAAEAYDAGALHAEVLTARVSTLANSVRPLDEVVQERLEETLRTDPEAVFQLGEQEAEFLGIANPGRELIMRLGQEAMEQEIWGQVRRQWRSVPPMSSRTFRFDGLDSVVRGGAEGDDEAIIQLRYQIQVTAEVPNAQVGLIMDLNNERRELRVPTGQVQVLPLPASLIDENGRLDVTVHNRDPQNPNRPREATLVFDAGTGVEVLYTVGTFGPNFARAMLVNWMKLSFLAMLGLTAATFLSFPVASLLGMLIYFSAIASPYLMEAAFEYGGGFGASGMVRDGVAGFSSAFASLLSRYAEYNPTPAIVGGRLFGWDQVVGCLVWVGFLWTGCAAVVGAIVFRNRELAHVQV